MHERMRILGIPPRLLDMAYSLSKTKIITYKFNPQPTLTMEQALILGKISHRVPTDILEQFKTIEGVSDANLIYGPYDFYVTIKTESKEMMGDIAFKIRSIDGVLDSLTCYVVNYSDIRPDASGPGIE
jgi:nitrate reductase NapAB chaperone NapD